MKISDKIKADPAEAARIEAAMAKRVQPPPATPVPTWPLQHIPDDYQPTPKNAVEGGCGCKK